MPAALGRVPPPLPVPGTCRCAHAAAPRPAVPTWYAPLRVCACARAAPATGRLPAAAVVCRLAISSCASSVFSRTIGCLPTLRAWPGNSRATCRHVHFCVGGGGAGLGCQAHGGGERVSGVPSGAAAAVRRVLSPAAAARWSAGQSPLASAPAGRHARRRPQCRFQSLRGMWDC